MSRWRKKPILRRLSWIDALDDDELDDDLIESIENEDAADADAFVTIGDLDEPVEDAAPSDMEAQSADEGAKGQSGCRGDI